jgi:hypothetical protein
MVWVYASQQVGEVFMLEKYRFRFMDCIESFAWPDAVAIIVFY